MLIILLSNISSSISTPCAELDGVLDEHAFAVAERRRKRFFTACSNAFQSFLEFVPVLKRPTLVNASEYKAVLLTRASVSSISLTSTVLFEKGSFPFRFICISSLTNRQTSLSMIG